MPAGKMTLSAPRRTRLNTTIRKLKKDVRNLKMGQELKFTIKEFTDTDNDESGDFIEIFLPTQGTADTQRIGDTCIVKSIQVKGTIHLNTNLFLQHTRLIIFYDKNDVITDPSTEILFNSPTSAPYQPLHYYNVDHRKQWTLIMDKNYVLDSAHQIIKVNFKKNLNKVVQFSGAGINITSGSFKIFAISSKPNLDAADDKLTYRINCRFRFVDS